MTDIDPQADLEIRFAGEHVTVKVPLAGPWPASGFRTIRSLR
jgi:hypothetical protein